MTPIATGLAAVSYSAAECLAIAPEDYRRGQFCNIQPSRSRKNFTLRTRKRPKPRANAPAIIARGNPVGCLVLNLLSFSSKLRERCFTRFLRQYDPVTR